VGECKLLPGMPSSLSRGDFTMLSMVSSSSTVSAYACVAAAGDGGGGSMERRG